MNDFVDRLLGRIDAPPIRPLVPTLFEPANPVGAEPGLPMGTFTESPRKPVPAKENERVREVPVPLRPTGEPATTHEIVTESRTATEHTTVLRSERLVESSLELEREVRTEQVQRETVSQPVLAAEPANAPDLPAAAQAHVIEPVHVPPLASPRPEPEPTPGLSAAAQTHAIEPVRAHPIARPRPAPEPPPRRPPVLRRQNAPAEPDVHISIGRVEVTARPAPVSAPKPQKERKPLLSLDDYLRERG